MSETPELLPWQKRSFGTSHIIQDCPKCGGIHEGSYECPIFCIACARGNDLPEGEYCRVCGRTGPDIHPPPVYKESRS
jgi:hypothetical protein